ncbi:MAG TPA: DUF3786 domain-containing protein [Syntrophobacteria bacterium]|nr:DUF3786 domain-containing protein [Syntrophobacteria bacterium]
MSAGELNKRDEGSYRDPEKIDPKLWEELSIRDGNETSLRSAVRLDTERGCYLIPYLNRSYLVFPRERRIEGLSQGGEEKLSFQFYLVLLTYLLRARAIPLSGRMMTGMEIKGGDLFFRGHHALFTKPLEKRFGTDPEAFLKAGLRLGGSKTDFGDVSFRLWPLPRIPLGYILWSADEEFPARVGVTFDASIAEQLPLDVTWALVNEVGRALLGA